MSDQSEKTLRDFETIFQELFNWQLERDLILKLIPYVINIYQNNSDKIGSPEYLCEHTGLKNVPHNLDEASFLKYVVEHEFQHLQTLLKWILITPDLPFGRDILEMISTMENYFLSSLTCLHGPKSQTNSISGATRQQFQFKCKTPHGSEFWVRWFYPTSPSNFESEHALLKKYEGICFHYVTGMQRTQVPNFIVTNDQFEGKIILTISHIPDSPLDSWMNATFPQRRNFETPKEQIRSQIQMSRGVFKGLEVLLRAKLSDLVLLPKQTMIHDAKSGLPKVQFDASIIHFEGETKSCSQFDQLFTQGNTPTKTTFCIGMIMLYSLSATTEEDFHKLAHEFTTTKNENDFKMEIIGKYAPIIAASKSLMNLVHRVIHSTYSSHQIINLFVDWTALSNDFAHEEDEINFFGIDERVKLLVYPVGRGVIEDLFLELIKLPLTLSSVDKLVDKLFNEEGILPDVELKKSLDSFESILYYVKDTRPWLIRELISNLEIHFSSQLFTKLFKSISTHWLKQIQNFSYLGVGEHGYLFQKEEDATAMPEFRSRIMLLLPKPGASIKVVSKMFSKINLNLSRDHFLHFYDGIEQRTIYSEQLYNYISSSTYLPRGVVDLIHSGYYVQFWLIQYRAGRTSLQDYLANSKPLVVNSFAYDIIESLFHCVEFYGVFNIPVPMPSPENIFFVDWISSGTQGSGKFKLPVVIGDQSLITLTSEQHTSNLTRTERPTIVYKLGLLILQLLFPENCKIGVEELLGKIESVYPNHHYLSCLLREMMLPNGKESMNLEHFQNLEIASIGLMPVKRPPFTLRDDIDTITLLNHGDNQNIVGDVVALLYDDIIELTRSSNPTHADWQENLDRILIEDRSSGCGHFKELECNREKFEEMSNVLQMLKNKSLANGYLWIKEIFLFGAFDNPRFREKLASTIKSVWVKTILSEIELIGCGSFGLVFQTSDETWKDRKCATKLIVPSNEDEAQNVIREVENVRGLFHPNVIWIKNHATEILLAEADFKVLLKGELDIPNDKTESEVSSSGDPATMRIEKLILRSRQAPVPCCLIKMNLGGPTLRQFLAETFNLRKNPENKIGRYQLAICRDLIRGMQYLQSKKILHCDLKPDNILLATFGIPINQFEENFDDKFMLPVQFADFGLSFTLDGNTHEFSKIRRGNLRYQAPEAETTFSSEIYSIGLIIFEVLVPCVGAGLRNLTEKLVSNSTLKFNADEIPVQEFILGLRSFLQKDVKNRMSVQDFQMFDVDWVHLYNFFLNRVQEILKEIIGYKE
ncbi:uncharacterized protein LOC118439520 [Folsomia candida]|uniref:Serine/threonine-protein kinase 36 n=1 Tax=Folsomia candida TaxID=158441 RepID=A0A226D488_FOLCA|nr:uncharacterized protein LOC118439520 [Folsomia candida]OXA39638.1 Serine/threonine-protein kinase 36 [Folsomia candida]